MANVTEQVAVKVTGHAIDLLRVSDTMRVEVLSALEELEGMLIDEMEEIVGKTLFTQARMKALLAQTSATIDTAYDAIDGQLSLDLGDLGKLAQQITMDAVNATVGVDLLTVALAPEQLEAIVNKSILFGQSSSGWWANQSERLKDAFAREMRAGQLRGESIDALTRRVRGTKAMGFKDGIMNAPKHAAEALVRTSVLGVSNEARNQMLIANRDVVKGVQWLSTLDTRTTEICMALDGLSWDYPAEGDKYADFEPVGHDKEFDPPPAHWQCRSTTVPVTFSWEELAGRHGNSEAAKKADKVPKGKRASMDGQVSGKLTFDGWLERQSASAQDEALGPTVAQLWRDGKIEAINLTDARNHPLTVAELVDKYGP